MPGTAARIVATGAVLAAALTLAGCAENGDSAPVLQEPTQDLSAGVTADIMGADGSELGTATFSDVDGGTEITIEVSNLDPGMHGLHIHEFGVCEPDSEDPEDSDSTGDFLSSGGHYDSGDNDHAEHRGDLPALLVTGAGTGRLSALTDRFTTAELVSGNGTTVMIHAEPDNYGNIPERYDEDGPDEETLSTGDAGDRIACGVIE